MKAGHITSKFLKAVFHKFYLVNSWILWPKWNFICIHCDFLASSPVFDIIVKESGIVPNTKTLHGVSKNDLENSKLVYFGRSTSRSYQRHRVVALWISTFFQIWSSHSPNQGYWNHPKSVIVPGSWEFYINMFYQYSSVKSYKLYVRINQAVQNNKPQNHCSRR